MSIIKNISLAMQEYKAARQSSLSELSEELGIPVSSLQCYLKGTSDLRASTIEMLAEKMNVPLTEIVSGPAPEWERAESIILAASEFSGLPDGKQEQGIQLFLALVALFAKDS